jgi:hypothetical protein
MRRTKKKQMVGRQIVAAAVSCVAKATSILMNRIDLSLHLREHTVPNFNALDTRGSEL